MDIQTSDKVTPDYNAAAEVTSVHRNNLMDDNDKVTSDDNVATDMTSVHRNNLTDDTKLKYKILYKFFEKPTSSKLCTLEHSATSWNQQRATLSQEVIRRLLNTSQELDHSSKTKILEDYIIKLRRSKYNTKQIRDIIQSGLVGYKTKWEPLTKIHREACETEGSRRTKKLVGKTSWFKKRRGTEDRQQSNQDRNERHQPRDRDRQKKLFERRPDTVMFVDRTKGGALATALRAKERELNQFSTKRVKIVERNGQQVQALLTNPDPWGDTVCHRGDCLPCTRNEDKTQCRSANVVYESVCKLCKAQGQTTKYLGETSRSLYERTAEHLRDLLSRKETSHMFSHLTSAHPTHTTPSDTQSAAAAFEIKVVKVHKTALSRQVHEALAIGKAGGSALNSKDEYTRCVIPSLTVTHTERPPELTQPTHQQAPPAHTQKRYMDANTLPSSKRPRLGDEAVMPPPPTPSQTTAPTTQQQPLTKPNQKRKHARTLSIKEMILKITTQKAKLNVVQEQRHTMPSHSR